MDNNPLLSAEEEAAREYAATRKITRIVLEDNIEDFHVIDENREVKSSFQLLEVDCLWKHLIFRALKAAYNEIFIHENTAESNKDSFLSNAQEFWVFVRHYPTSESALRVKVIKNYEAYKIDTYGLKPISAGLNEIKRFINIALSSSNFNKALTSAERDFLYTITEVKATPSYHDIKPINLNTWFTQQAWLRTNEYGVGHTDYTSLSLPKRLMASFTVTTGVCQDRCRFSCIN